MKFTVGSLFSGIGGLELGLERAGMTVIWQVENDKYATRVLEKHWPKVKRYGDIKSIDWNNVERPDLICGGFPCQDISCAGKGVGIKKGTRSGLWKEFYKAIRALRPQYVLIENVAMLANRGLGIVLTDLAEAGYDAEWFTLSAADVGAPHRRERLFIVAHSDNRQRNGTEEEIRTGRDASNGGSPDVVNTEKPGLQGLIATRIFGPDGCLAKCRSRCQWAEDPADTNPASKSYVGRVAHGVPSRVDRLKCLGNAVVPQVAEIIGRAIKEEAGRGLKC